MTYLPCWTVYDHPRDHPAHFVARRWVDLMPTGTIMLADDIAALRAEMTDMGLIRIGRNPDDDPVIVEVWI